MVATTVSKQELLSKLNISSATLDNWIRTSIPNALIEDRYDLSIVENFVKDKKKLKSRANKKKSTKTEYPKELVKYLSNSEWVIDYMAYIQGKEKEQISNEIIDIYKKRLRGDYSNAELAKIIPHDDLYSYSVAYQILLDAGNKSQNGAYYTPKFIVQEIVERLIAKGKTFLDPCCGVGFYTLEYIKAYKNRFECLPDVTIYSNDIDPVAAEITKLNIINLTNNDMRNFVVTCLDGIKLPYRNIDLVITNPPYGIKYKSASIKTTEIFSHFIHKTLSQYLSKNGSMNFILPHSFLAIERHREIRKYAIENHTLENIKHYGKSFDGVFSDIVSVQIKNRKENHSIVKMTNKEGEKDKFACQEIFIKNDYKITHTDRNDMDLLSIYYEHPHCTLNDAIFALGIVTGDNQKFILNKETSGVECKEIISGKDVFKGSVLYKNKKYIINTPSKYQQKPDMHLFSKKKIIYRFISKDIVSAVDSTGVLTLNSANVIIITNNLSEEYVSAVLNSSTINFIHKAKFGAPLKILKKNIQGLPIFLFEKETQRKIIENYKNGEHYLNDKLIEDKVRGFKSVRKEKA